MVKSSFFILGVILAFGFLALSTDAALINLDWAGQQGASFTLTYGQGASFTVFGGGDSSLIFAVSVQDLQGNVIHAYSTSVSPSADIVDDVYSVGVSEYKNPGTYKIVATLTDGVGLFDSDTLFLTVNPVQQPPVENPVPQARITVDKTSVPVGGLVAFDASQSTDDKGIVAYGWKFGDSITSASEIVTHSYAQAGTYTVVLTVIDTEGKQGTVTQPITVTAAQPPINQPPLANVVQDNFQVKTGEQFTLDGSVSSDPDNDPLIYLWTASVNNPQQTPGLGTANKVTLTLNTLGSYQFSLQVSDGKLFSLAKTITVVVTSSNTNMLPQAVITSKDNGFVNELITFDGSQSKDDDGTIATYQWLFGIGIVKEGKTVTHAYSTPGTYTPRLTVTDNKGATSEIQKTVVINEAPFVEPVLNFEIVEDSLTLELLQDASSTINFTIKNNGTQNVNNLVFTYGTLPEGISLTFTSPLVQAGQEGKGSVQAEASNLAEIKRYQIPVNVTRDTVKDSFILNIDVLPDLCRVRSPDLEITIREPDKGDDVKPFDILDIDVDVRNRADTDLDIEIDAELWNVREGDLLTSISSDQEEIRDGSKENFNLQLEIPDDRNVNANDDLVLFVKAEDNGVCNFAQINLDVVREDREIVIEEFSIIPDRAAAGEDVSFRVNVRNSGTRDDDSVEIVIRNSELGLELREGPFTLESFEEIDDELTRVFRYVLPSTAEQQPYEITAEVIFNKGKDRTSLSKTLTVRGAAAKVSVDTLQFFDGQEDVFFGSQGSGGGETTSPQQQTSLFVTLGYILGILLVLVLIIYSISVLTRENRHHRKV